MLAVADEHGLRVELVMKIERKPILFGVRDKRERERDERNRREGNELSGANEQRVHPSSRDRGVWM